MKKMCFLVIGSVLVLFVGSAAGDPPGGSDTQVQFNDGGAFAGSSKMIFDPVSGKLTVTSIETTSVSGSNGLLLRDNPLPPFDCSGLSPGDLILHADSTVAPGVLYVCRDDGTSQAVPSFDIDSIGSQGVFDLISTDPNEITLRVESAPFQVAPVFEFTDWGGDTSMRLMDDGTLFVQALAEIDGGGKLWSINSKGAIRGKNYTITSKENSTDVARFNQVCAPPCLADEEWVTLNLKVATAGELLDRLTIDAAGPVRILSANVPNGGQHLAICDDDNSACMTLAVGSDITGGTVSFPDVENATVAYEQTLTKECQHVREDDPNDTEAFFMMKAPYALTLSGIDCGVIGAGGSSVDLSVEECDATMSGPSCVSSTSVPIACDEDGAVDTGFSNPTIDAGDWVRIQLANPTNAPSDFTATVCWTRDLVTP